MPRVEALAAMFGDVFADAPAGAVAVLTPLAMLHSPPQTTTAVI